MSTPKNYISVVKFCRSDDPHPLQNRTLNQKQNELFSFSDVHDR